MGLMTTTPFASVTAVSKDDAHRFSKLPCDGITLVEGVGVDGDAHAGKTVQHLSRVAANPDEPNLRQVHLIHAELLDEVRAHGYDVAPGDLGENVLTRGLDLLSLPRDTVLRLGDAASVRVTGLRNPCVQIDGLGKGLLGLVVGRDEHGGIVRKAGIMSVVLSGGAVRPGDRITVELPPEPHARLEVV